MNVEPELDLGLTINSPTHTGDLFRKLYYRLYANSEASRAERIFEDIAKVLLLKWIRDKSNPIELQKFIDGQAPADSLVPLLVKRFPEFINKNDTFSVGDIALREGLQQVDSVNLVEAPAAVMGEAFQALIGPRLRGDKGQFFTPRALVRAMVQVVHPKDTDKVVDPAAGTGGFLLECYRFRKENYSGASKFERLIGLEKDKDLFRLGGAMVKVATDNVGIIQLVNSLDLVALEKLDISPYDADIVLTNPPFGSKIGIDDTQILEKFALGHNWAFSPRKQCWQQLSTTRKTQDPQLLFLELCFKLLKPGGLLGIILPEGIFGNRKSGYVWDFVRSVGEIQALIDCPRTTFQPSTDTKTNVLFVKKQSNNKSTLIAPLVAVAKTCGHDRRGGKFAPSGAAIQNDFEKIGKAFLHRDSDWWNQCEITDRYYLVPRFYSVGAMKAVIATAQEWKGNVTTIDDLIKDGHLYIRKGHEVGAEEYGTGPVPFVRTSDIHNWEIALSPTNGVSEHIYAKYKRAQNLKPYDVLLVVDGRYKIGRTAILQLDWCKCVVQSHFRIITARPGSPINGWELLYILNLPSVLEEIRNLVFIQSTLGSVGRRLGQLKLPVPKKTDEWNTRIAEFRAILEGRGKLLSQLERFENPEPEL